MIWDFPLNTIHKNGNENADSVNATQSQTHGAEAALALSDLNADFLKAHTVSGQLDEGLGSIAQPHLGVIQTEISDGVSVGGAKATGGIGYLLAGDNRNDFGQQATAYVSDKAKPVADTVFDTAADNKVGRSSLQRSYQSGDIEGPMLAVAVKLDGNVVVISVSEHIAGLHGPADPEINGQPDSGHIELIGDIRCAVRRTIINNQDVRPREMRPEVLDDPGYRGGLVEGRDDSQDAEILFHEKRKPQRAEVMVGIG